MMHPLFRHISACRNATLPGDRVPFLIDGEPVGWVRASLASRLGLPPGGIPAAALPSLTRRLADEGGFRWRSEAFDVRAPRNGAAGDGTVLATIDRGALPVFGVAAIGAHVNGLVRRADGLHVWVARRAADKALDPGKLDNVVAGGVPAGLTPRETVIKESAEEAAVPASLAATAREVARIGYAMERSEGLRRDLLVCYDLDLPEDFVPVATDGEVEGFELWPLRRVYETVRDTDAFKFNVNLVLIDLFLRTGMVEPDAAPALRAALDQDSI